MRKKPKAIQQQKLSYRSTDDNDMLYLVQVAEEGIQYNAFTTLADQSPFSMKEWSGFLHLSERTLQRYKKEKKTFDPIHAEKILEITLLNRYGKEVFGEDTSFNTWLEAKSVALGGMRPKELLHNTFGITMVRDALSRIEQGVLA